MEALQAFKSDLTFLLVGRNPIPNVVAGLLLAKQKDESADSKIILVYSEGTEAQKDNLVAFFKQRHSARVDSVLVDVSNAKSIASGFLANLPKDSSLRVGLHYTGGTKKMAINAFLALGIWRSENQLSKRVFMSYLGPTDFRLTIDAESPLDDAVSVRVAEAVHLNVEEMLELHSIRFKKAPERFNRLPGVTRLLCELYSTAASGDDWNSFSGVYFRSFFASELNSEKAVIFRSFLLELGLAVDPAVLTRADFQQVRLFKSYLVTGKWLEAEVFEILCRNREELGLTDVAWNVETRNDFNRPSEVDVVAIRGYQLFGFSCDARSAYHKDKGKAARKELKYKLYEAFIRMNQLGGEEARVGFVCRHAEPEQLLESASSRFDGSEGKVRVFGQADLVNLEGNIVAWVKSQIP